MEKSTMYGIWHEKKSGQITIEVFGPPSRRFSGGTHGDPDSGGWVSDPGPVSLGFAILQPVEGGTWHLAGPAGRADYASREEAILAAKAVYPAIQEETP